MRACGQKQRMCEALEDGESFVFRDYVSPSEPVMRTEAIALCGNKSLTTGCGINFPTMMIPLCWPLIHIFHLNKNARDV